MIHGIVIHGDGIGKTFGFPTANLDCKKEDSNIDSGVYAVWVFVNKEKYPGALAIRDNPWKVEVHLIGYDGDSLYDRKLKMDIVEKVSEMEKYESQEKLIEKIGEDVKKVKTVLRL